MENIKIKNLITSYDELLDNLKYVQYSTNKFQDLESLFIDCKMVYFSIRCTENKKYILSAYLNNTGNYNYFNDLLDNIYEELPNFKETNKFFIDFELYYSTDLVDGSGLKGRIRTINFSKDDLVKTFMLLGSKSTNINNYY